MYLCLCLEQFIICLEIIFIPKSLAGMAEHWHAWQSNIMYGQSTTAFRTEQEQAQFVVGNDRWWKKCTEPTRGVGRRQQNRREHKQPTEHTNWVTFLWRSFVVWELLICGPSRREEGAAASEEKYSACCWLWVCLVWLGRAAEWWMDPKVQYYAWTFLWTLNLSMFSGQKYIIRCFPHSYPPVVFIWRRIDDLHKDPSPLAVNSASLTYSRLLFQPLAKTTVRVPLLLHLCQRKRTEPMGRRRIRGMIRRRRRALTESRSNCLSATRITCLKKYVFIVSL